MYTYDPLLTAGRGSILETVTSPVMLHRRQRKSDV